MFAPPGPLQTKKHAHKHKHTCTQTKTHKHKHTHKHKYAETHVHVCALKHTSMQLGKHAHTRYTGLMEIFVT